MATVTGASSCREDDARPDSAPTPSTLGLDPDEEPTSRERLSVLVEHRADVPMAVLMLAWAALVAYELVAPPGQRGELRDVGNVYRTHRHRPHAARRPTVVSGFN